MHKRNVEARSGSLVFARTAFLTHFFAAIYYTFIEAI